MVVWGVERSELFVSVRGKVGRGRGCGRGSVTSTLGFLRRSIRWAGDAMSSPFKEALEARFQYAGQRPARCLETREAAALVRSLRRRPIGRGALCARNKTYWGVVEGEACESVLLEAFADDTMTQLLCQDRGRGLLGVESVKCFYSQQGLLIGHGRARRGAAAGPSGGQEAL